MQHRTTIPGAAKSGFEASLSAQQAQELAELKTLFEHKSPAYLPDLAQNPDGDRFLLRFLRATMKDKQGARVFDAHKAHVRLLKTLDWRRKYKVDDLRRALETGGEMPKGYDMYKKVRPALDFVDPATGRPVHVERFGLLANHLDPHHFPMDDWITYFAVDSERILLSMREESAKRQQDVSAMITVIDEAGVGWSSLSRLGFFKIMNEVSAEHYPELLGSIFILRAPWLFSKIFAVIKVGRQRLAAG
jgi:hypothetical protein